MKINFSALALALTLCFAPSSFAKPKATPSPPPTPASLDWDLFDSSVSLMTMRGKTSFVCSAVLINETTALTAAHCVDASDSNKIIYGKSLDDTSANTIDIDQKSIRIHPSYHPDASNYVGDLAVIHLKKPAKIGSYPKIYTAPLASAIQLERIGVGKRGTTNHRTWTSAFLIDATPHNLFLNDSLSISGDSGGPIYFADHSGDETKVSLVAIHSTQINEHRTAVVWLSDYADWIFQK